MATPCIPTWLWCPHFFVANKLKPGITTWSDSTNLVSDRQIVLYLAMYLSKSFDLSFPFKPHTLRDNNLKTFSLEISADLVLVFSLITIMRF